jgi:hypothetical protein
VSFYLTRFTSSNLLLGQTVVSFLWHFPWGYPRLPLTTALL